MEYVVVEEVEVKVDLAEAGNSAGQDLVLDQRHQLLVGYMTGEAEVHCSILVVLLVFEILYHTRNRLFRRCD